jgi:hypothetical protein
MLQLQHACNLLTYNERQAKLITETEQAHCQNSRSISIGY